jgi:hypothetical protein
MLEKPDLSPDFCIHAVVNSTPSPEKYQKGTAAITTLFDLDVVDDTMSAHFVQSLKRRIFPWLIEDQLVASSPDTTVQDAAASVESNAK